MQIGKDVEACCRKCGEVWHVVVARAEGRIAQVECKQCGARHRYRPVGGEGQSRSPRRRSASAGRSTSPRKRKPVVEADTSRPRRPFRASDTYQVGDRIVHATFGEGVVQAVVGARKIECLFDVGTKTLVHARGGAEPQSLPK